MRTSQYLLDCLNIFTEFIHFPFNGLNITSKHVGAQNSRLTEINSVLIIKWFFDSVRAAPWEHTKKFNTLLFFCLLLLLEWLWNSYLNTPNLCKNFSSGPRGTKIERDKGENKSYQHKTQNWSFFALTWNAILSLSKVSICFTTIDLLTLIPLVKLLSQLSDELLRNCRTFRLLGCFSALRARKNINTRPSSNVYVYQLRIAYWKLQFSVFAEFDCVFLSLWCNWFFYRSVVWNTHIFSSENLSLHKRQWYEMSHEWQTNDDSQQTNEIELST